MEAMKDEELISDDILNELAPEEDATSEEAEESTEEAEESQEASEGESSEEEQKPEQESSEEPEEKPRETQETEEAGEEAPEEEVKVEEVARDLDIPELNVPDVLPVPVMVQIQQDAEQAVMKEMGLDEIPDPDIDPQKYAQFRRASDALARHTEAIVVQQTKAQNEAQRFMIDLGAEKREKFIQFFDGLVMKMAQNPSTAAKAQIIMAAAQRNDFATLFPVMKKVYQAFAMKKGRKPQKPPKTEKPASVPRPTPSGEPKTAEELAKTMGYEYPELE